MSPAGSGRSGMGSPSWNTVAADVLVVGGGFGGLWAALRAAECGASVVLADKSFAGRSGHSCFAGGAMVTLLPEDPLEDALRDIVLGNEWLVDQEMAAAVLENSFARLQDLESFGIAFRRKGGRYVWTRARGTRAVRNLWPEHATAADVVLVLRKVALGRGVRILDHLHVYDLIRDAQGRVAGAVGVGVRDGGDYLLRAGSVVVATNSGSYRGHHLACELQGTGPFLAYDAGAVLQNPEFHYVNIRPVKHEIEGSGILPAVGARWKNAAGEYFMEKYDPVLKDRAPVMKIVVSAVREHLAGNTPVCIDVEGMDEEERERFRVLQVSHGWMPLLFQKCDRYEGYDPLTTNIEWQPAYESNKLGIRADVHGRTTVPGLFAAGMARNLGINPFTGWSIAACTWSGYAAGEGAAREACAVSAGEIDPVDAAERRARFFEPLAREGGCDPDAVTHALQKILFPAGVLILLHETRLREALERVSELQHEALPRLAARDLRTVIRAKETQTMLLSAEMTLRAARMRKETRENIFVREDHPHPDDRNWLKWIVARKGADGEIDLATADIPFERYPFRPPACRDARESVSSPAPEPTGGDAREP